jgi:hypothetical protein
MASDPAIYLSIDVDSPFIAAVRAHSQDWLCHERS